MPRGMKMTIAGISRLDLRSDPAVLRSWYSEPKIDFTSDTLEVESLSRILALGRSDPRSFLVLVPSSADEFPLIAAGHTPSPYPEKFFSLPVSPSPYIPSQLS